VIVLRGLVKRFGTHVVLDGIDLDVPRGETLVVLGRSGSGKSVLLKLIIGLLRPDSGSVRVAEQEVTTLDSDGLASLRQRMGMVFQMAALFDSMTVGENIGLGLREHRKLSETELAGIVAEKLRLVGLEGTEAKKPSDLSGGMRKRVGLARAIAMDPDVLLYDEPTTGLDPITAEQINLLIRDLQHKLAVTAVVVTHDMRSAFTVGTRLCLLHEGKILAQGTPEELRDLAHPAVQQFIRGDATGPLTEGPEPREQAGPAGARRWASRRSQ
jgi:phospholipid/cholesterol/gamma-HCH transport system ATP-binding protein